MGRCVRTCGGLRLAKGANPRRHVDDVAVDGTKVWQGKLAQSKRGDKVDLHQVLQLVDAEVVD